MGFSRRKDAVKVVILGSGNIGMDLMYKVKRSKHLEVGLVAGIDPDSPGLALASKEGYPTTHESIQTLVEEPFYGDIVFDATSAKGHAKHAPIIKEMGKYAIDLTPSAIGVPVVPVVNLEENIDQDNVGLISCGGQAVIPIIWAINKAVRVNYAEIVATLASKSAGPGTRQNIDEFTQTTAKGIRDVVGVPESKAIIILNPAEPPLIMTNTIYAIADEPDEEKIRMEVEKIVLRVQQYVPGYTLRVPPQVDGKKVTVILQVMGAGDYLPTYAGNLDIITSAAVAVAEGVAAKKLGKVKANKTEN